MSKCPFFVCFLHLPVMVLRIHNVEVTHSSVLYLKGILEKYSNDMNDIKMLVASL